MDVVLRQELRAGFEVAWPVGERPVENLTTDGTHESRRSS